MKKLMLFLLLASSVKLFSQCPSSVTTNCIKQNSKTITIPNPIPFLPPIELDGGTYEYSFTIPNGEGLDCTNLPANIVLNAIIPPFIIPIDFDFEREDPCDDSNGVTYTEILCLPDGGNDLCNLGTPSFVIDLGSITCIYDMDGILLPVELTNFAAVVIENGIKLGWQTATESNNEGFEIQRSQDTKNWKILDFQMGAGTTSEPQKYSYLDKTALPGINYYRLKQIDYTGTFEYSEVVAAEIKEEQTEVLAFPNPAKEMVFLSLERKSEVPTSDIQINIFDSLGRFVKLVKDFPGNAETLEISLSGLAAGTYTLEIDNGLNRQYLRILKN